MPPRRAAGHRWEAVVRAVVDRDGGLCWVCKHGGARHGDHVIPVTERPDLMLEMSNVRAVHGAPGNPCAACTAACGGRKVHCNQLKGMGSLARARRIIAEWAEAARRGEAPAPRKTGYTAGRPAAQSPPEPHIPPGSGRPW